MAGCSTPSQPEAPKEGANKRGNSSRLTQSFHFFMFEPIF
ncbi:transcriptional regulator, partial [Escherichia coli]